MKIAITGGTGYIGTNLVGELYPHHQLVALVRFKKNYPQFKDYKNLEQRQVDFSSPTEIKKSLTGVDAVYHLAGLLPNVSCSDQTYYETNSELVKRVFTAASQTESIKHFILCSTAYINWYQSIGRNAGTIYDRSKLSGENIAWKLSKKTGLPLTVIRPGFVYGNYHLGLLPFFKLIKKGLFFYVGSGEQTFELTHVKDVVRFFSIILNQKKAFNKSYLLSPLKPLTYKQLITSISYSLKVPPPTKHMPPQIFLILLQLLSFLKTIFRISLPLSNDSYYTFTQPRFFDASEALKDFGYSTKEDQGQEIGRLQRFYQQNSYL